jgi:hypothetical protein
MAGAFGLTALCAHYGMQPTCSNRGLVHEKSPPRESRESHQPLSGTIFVPSPLMSHRLRVRLQFAAEGGSIALFENAEGAAAYDQ